MNPYDKVRELVEAIKSSEEVKTYLNLKEEIYKDDEFIIFERLGNK